MKRRVDFVVVAAALALAAIALILLGILPAPGRGPDVPRAPETTLRNVTDAVVSYSVRYPGPGRRAEKRELRPGGVDRLPADRAFEVTYESGGKTHFFIASPGKPYSFRLNEKSFVQIYPGSHGRADAVDLAPYVQTPLPVVERMLELAGIGPDDLLYDIGSGDGRVVLLAARKYGARAVGIDIIQSLVDTASAAARRQGVADRARFVCGDATKIDLSEATVVTLYLLPESNDLLRPKLERELQPGARVVSHGYVIPGWEGRLIGQANVVDSQGREHSIFAYRIPGS